MDKSVLKIHIPDFILNNLPKFVITAGAHPINHPFEYFYFNKGMFFNDNMNYRQYEETTDKAVEHFTRQVESIDTGCVQLWQLNKNNNTYYEMGSLYL